MSDKIGVYCIQNKETNMIYIGSSIKINQRVMSHVYRLNSGKHDNKQLQKDWSKYGIDGFNFKIVCECSKDKLKKTEQYFIDFYKSNKNGYNRKNEIATSNNKNFFTHLPEEYISAVTALSEVTGYNKRELSEIAFELLFKKFGVQITIKE